MGLTEETAHSFESFSVQDCIQVNELGTTTATGHRRFDMGSPKASSSMHATSFRFIALALLLALLSWAGIDLFAQLNKKEQSLAPGDVDGNGQVDIWDARSLDRSLASKSFRVPYPSVADVSQNGVIDRGDFEALEKRAHGISTIETSVNDDNDAPVVIGGIATVEVSDTFLPLDITEGSVRITSAATNYDSGVCRLVHLSYGSSLVYHWDTTHLRPASDYVAEVQLKKRPRGHEASSDADEPKSTVSDEAPLPGQNPASASETSARKQVQTDVLPISYTVPVADNPAASSTGNSTAADSDVASVADGSPRQQQDVPSSDDVVSGSGSTDDNGSADSPQQSSHNIDFGHSPRDSSRIQIRLVGRPREFPLLAECVDLSLPFWNLDLQIARRYFYTATKQSAVSEFGRGWAHAFGLRLKEHTDGMIEVRGGGPFTPAFQPVGQGQYRTLGGSYNQLVRDPDGAFRLFMKSGEKWRFDSSLRLTSILDDQGHAITVEYDDDRLHRIVDEAQQSLTFEYNSEALVTRVRDSLGRTATYQYDDAQNLIAVTSPVGSTQSYAYDDEHRLTHVAEHGSAIRTIAYGVDGLVERIDGRQPIEFRYQVDPFDNGGRTIQAAGSQLLYEEVATDGRVVARRMGTEGEAVRFDYDDKNELQKLTGPGSITWSMERDLLEKRTTLTLPDGGQKSWFDLPERNGAAAIDANGVATMLRFLDNGQLTHVIHPDGLTEVRRYPETRDGSLVKCELRSGQTVQYTFDNRGLLQAAQLNKDLPSKYFYDGAGNLVLASNQWGTLIFQYDQYSRLVTCTYPGSRTIRYEYDKQGRRTSVTDPNNNVLKYDYDDKGRITGIRRNGDSEVIAYAYDSAGNVAAKNSANGMSVEYAHDVLGAATSIVSRGVDGESISTFTYTYDTAGRRTGSVRDGGEEKYLYDSCGRLAEVKVDGEVTHSFQYDSAGNRLASSGAQYASNVMNQTSRAGDSTQTFDLNGNLNAQVRAAERTAYEHDATNRLLYVRLPQQQTVAYQYDPLGRLATRTVNGQTTRYFWDGEQMLTAETDGRQSVRSFIWGREAEELVAFETDGEVFYTGQDASLSITHVTDSDGKLLGEISYDPFGAPRGDNFTDLPFRFRAAFFDEQTQLYCMGSRWYAPTRGTYLERHPLSPLNGIHPYAYASGDPFNTSPNRDASSTHESNDFASRILNKPVHQSAMPSAVPMRLLRNDVQPANISRSRLQRSHLNNWPFNDTSPILVGQLDGVRVSR